MGRSASARANELFAEDVVMNQYEALFAELAQRRSAAPAEARRGRSMPASLDPVQAFSPIPAIPPKPLQATSQPQNPWTACPKLVRGSSTDVAPSR